MQSRSKLTLALALGLAVPAQAAAIGVEHGVEGKQSKTKPNIVWFVTDDQDQMLGGSFPQVGGVGPMAQTKALMQQAGAMATNFFIHTPICCPSRSELVRTLAPVLSPLRQV